MKCQMGARFIIGVKMELKEPKNYHEQMEIIRSKGFCISNEEEAMAFLSNVNYYRFSGYILPYATNKNQSQYTFNQLKAIYEFDSKLRNLIVWVIEDIEISLRAKISYFHAYKYGAEGYKDSKNFNVKHNADSFSDRVEGCIRENRRTPVVTHHQQQYEGRFPIWVLIEFFSIGMLSYFYRDLKNQDKSYLAKEIYGVSYQVLESWLRCLTDLRNKCAHYNRLYYWKFTALPKMPPDEKYKPTRRLFAQLYMLKHLYPDKDKWNQDFMKPLIKLFREYNGKISREHLDFPYRWKSMLMN